MSLFSWLRRKKEKKQPVALRGLLQGYRYETPTPLWTPELAVDFLSPSFTRDDGPSYSPTHYDSGSNDSSSSYSDCGSSSSYDSGGSSGGDCGGGGGGGGE